MHRKHLIIWFLLWAVFIAIVAAVGRGISVNFSFFIFTVGTLGVGLGYLLLSKAESSLDFLQQEILREASYAIIATDPKGVITFFNPAAERMLGYLSEDLIGKEMPSLFHDPLEVAARAAEFSKELKEPLSPGFDVFIAKSRHGLPNIHEWDYIRKDGSHLPVMLAISALRDHRKKIIGFLGIASDISVQRQSQYDLIVARDQLVTAAEVAKLGVWTWTLADNSLSWNDRMFEMYQQPKQLRNTGLNYEHWHSRLHPDDAESTASSLMQAVAGKGVYNPVFRILLPDGSIRLIQGGAQIERDKNGNAIRVTGINLDITDQHAYEDLLRGLVYIDGLTNIANRRRFEEQLAAEFSRAERKQASLALLMIDVDFFKPYNDHYGHQAGDVCLQKIAATLKANMLRPGDLAARYGGEEFVCLLPETDLISARMIAERCIKAIQELGIEHTTSSVAPVLTVSIGVAAIYPSVSYSPESLVAAADAQLYKAKEEGRNRACG